MPRSHSIGHYYGKVLKIFGLCCVVGLVIFALFPGDLTKYNVLENFNSDLQKNFHLHVATRSTVLGRFLPRPTLTVGPSQLLDEENHEIANCDTLTIELSWLELLRGKFEPKGVELIGGQIHLPENVTKLSASDLADVLRHWPHSFAIRFHNFDIFTRSQNSPGDPVLKNAGGIVDWPGGDRSLIIRMNGYRNEEMLHASLWVRYPLQLLQNDEKSFLIAHVKGFGLNSHFKGTLFGGKLLNLEGFGDIQIDDSDHVQKLKDLHLSPLSRFKRIKAASWIKISPDSANFEPLTLEFDDSSLEGLIALRQEDNKNLWFATLASTKMILDRGLIDESLSRFKYALETERSQTKYQKINTIDLRLSVDNLLLDGTKIKNVALSLNLRENLLQIHLIDAALFDGIFSGEVKFVLTHPPDFTLSGKFFGYNLDLSLLCHDLFCPFSLNGRMSFKSDGQSSATNLADIPKNLVGNLTTNVHDGSFEGFDFDKALRRLRRMNSEILYGLQTGSTPFTEGSARVKFQSSRAIIDQLNVKGPATTLTANGWFSLIPGTMDLKLEATQTLLDSNEETPHLWLQFSGPWSKPNIAVEQEGISPPS